MENFIFCAVYHKYNVMDNWFLLPEKEIYKSIIIWTRHLSKHMSTTLQCKRGHTFLFSGAESLYFFKQTNLIKWIYKK